MNESYVFKLFSHRNPDKLLYEHLKNTANLSKKIIDEKVLNLDNIDKGILSNISFIIGLSHDIGKATNYFQEYLKVKDEGKKNFLKNKPETHHSFLSSLFTYYLVKNYIECNNYKEQIFINYLPIISFFVVKRHHSNLHNADDEVYLDEDEERVIENQLNDINYDELQKIFDLTINKNISLNVKIENIAVRIINNYKIDIFKNDKRKIQNLNDEQDLIFYFITQFLYSSLLNADKTDVVVNEDINIERQIINPNIVDNYKKEKFVNQKENINKLRDRIYNEVINKVKETSLDDKIFSLNVPTGVGKTLTSLSFALKLREKIENEKKFTPKIIYSLPFLSIIEQNYNVFEDLFLNVDGKAPGSSILLKHHHLSEITYKTKENEFEIDEAELLIEGWNSEIIVTTFWQFFHTLFSNKNSLIRKFHNLINSIIILDEIQTIPHKYWRLISESLKFLTNKFNSYIILVTATQPLIFEEKEIKELVENKEKYFKEIDRVNLNINLNVLHINEFKNIIAEDLNKNKDKNILIVLNTIKSSIDIFNFIKKINLKDTEIYYLSTNIIPRDRLKRINRIKENKSSKRKVIISTQLVEAGVDIDADIVYRDFAPLDSINQVAGRCNRNLKEEKGNVYIFILKDEKQELYKYIYDAFLVSKTKDIFNSINNKVIEEPRILELNNRYFIKVREGMSDDESNENLRYLYTLSFKEIGEKFKLIEEDHLKIDVFIEIDDEAKEVWSEFKQIKKIENLFERKKEFLKIKKKFYDYVISVEKKYVFKEPDEGTNIIHIGMNELMHSYNIDTGFITDKFSEGIAIF